MLLPLLHLLYACVGKVAMPPARDPCLTPFFPPKFALLLCPVGYMLCISTVLAQCKIPCNRRFHELVNA